MGRTSRRLRARELGGVAATPPAGLALDLDPRSTSVAIVRAVRPALVAWCFAPGQPRQTSPRGSPSSTSARLWAALRVRLVAPALSVALTLLAGCASAPEPLELGPPPGGPTRPALQVAPLELAFEATPDRPTVKAGVELTQDDRVECVACGELIVTPAGPTLVQPIRPRCPDCEGDTFFRDPFSTPYRPRLSGPAIDTELVGALRARGAFASVEPRAPDAVGWRLEARVESSAVRYSRNGVFGLEIATFIITAVFIFPCVDIPNWFFASEDYTLELRGSWTLVDVAGGERVVAEGTVLTTTTGSFAELGPGPTREWHLVGFLRAPGCLEEDEWSEIADQLVPTAQLDFARELVRQLEAVKP